MNKNKKEEIIGFLKTWLETQKMFENKKDILKYLDISNSHFNNIVRGVRTPSDELIEKIKIMTEFDKQNKKQIKNERPYQNFTEEMRRWFSKQNRWKSQVELADYLGIPQGTIGKYFTGRALPKGELKNTLYDITGIELLRPEKIIKQNLTKKIKSEDVKSLKKNIQGIVQATKTIEQEISDLQAKISKNKENLAISTREAQPHKRFAIAFYQLADEIKTFRQSAIKDREKLRALISVKDVGYVSSFLKALFDEDKFSDFILFSDYKFESTGERNE